MATKGGKNDEKPFFFVFFKDYFKKNIVFMRLFRETVYFCGTLLTKK